ncbi:MAG: penicillin acylase family protein [Terriglobia bacterium]
MRKKTDHLVRSILIVVVGVALWDAAHMPHGAVEAASPGAEALPDTTLEAQAHTAVSVINGKIKLVGLHHPVTVLRDRWGVPHIYAQDQHDLFFAQGFVASQDRLFQMELWKRLGQGRLAEILGPSMVAGDVNARRLRYRGAMAAEYESYSPDTKEILEAFTEGINANIRSLKLPGRPGLPVEFRLAGFSPEPWKPEDCLLRMAGFPMTGNAGRELFHAQLVALVGAEGAARLLDLDPVVKLDPVPGLDLSGLPADFLHNLPGSDERLEFPAEPGAQGSNNWTVSGKLTTTGRPILANDPHRAIVLPSLRYVVHLVAPGWDVIGAGEPALSGVAIGHNQHVAWGITIFPVDQQDLYVETTDTADPLRYKTETGWERMRVEEEEIRIRGKPSVRMPIKFTRHGPVMWEDPTHHRVLALRWVGAEPGTAGYLASLAIDRVQNWQQFEAAMPRWKVPPENIVYADTAGNIGEHSMGLTPLRKNWSGQLPVPGGQGYEWSGWIPAAKLPHQFNPAAGFVASANHRMIPEDYPYEVGNEWSAPYRFLRIHEVLGDAAKHGQKLSLEDLGRLQSDVVSLPARELQPLLAHAVGGSTDAPARLLLNWNCSVDRESAAAALFEIWMQEVQRSVYQLLAPQSAWRILEGHGALPVAMRHLENPDEATFGPSPAAARDRLLLSTLRTAVDKLSALEGPEPAQWSWGNIHVVHLRHPLDRLPGAGFMDLDPLARPGDGFTVCATTYPGNNYAQTHGASFREVLDVGNWDDSKGINVPGESAQPGSPHYGDLLAIWIEGHYFPLLYSRPAVEKAATDRLRLEP